MIRFWNARVCVSSVFWSPFTCHLRLGTSSVRHIPNHWSKLVSVVHWRGKEFGAIKCVVPTKRNFGMVYKKLWGTVREDFFFTPRRYNYFIPNSTNIAIQATTRLCNIVRDRTGGWALALGKNPFGRISFGFWFLNIFFFTTSTTGQTWLRTLLFLLHDDLCARLRRSLIYN